MFFFCRANAHPIHRTSRSLQAETGIGDSLPVSRPNRESGERELGISGSDRGTLA